MLGKLAKLADKYALFGTCECQSPSFEFRNGLLRCRACSKPVNQTQWNETHKKEQAK